MFIMSVLISITYFYFYAMVILNLLERVMARYTSSANYRSPLKFYRYRWELTSLKSFDKSLLEFI